MEGGALFVFFILQKSVEFLTLNFRATIFKDFFILGKSKGITICSKFLMQSYNYLMYSDKIQTRLSVTRFPIKIIFLMEFM